LHESRDESCYCWGPAERRVHVAFRKQGEGFLPAALASMACKYLREVCMKAFNAFWQSHIPELRATAGYPVDARRFRAEIADLQRELQISNRILWRNR
ncbi:MAG: hypothetical protein KDA42_02460, partial [Planctomycetales bacterium]|nr:hypothetical protein [Planctomycetales bacterium]